ncbi:MAG: ligase-associated DNA damage response endonuclease PdeM, partial [Pseudomonadota bacterium]
LLVVSDLHFEKGSSYAAAGQMLPPYDTRATLSHVEKLMDHHTPQTVISLGDSFHDGRAAARLSAEDADRIRALTSRCDWLWVEGNHDPDPPQHLGGRAAPEVRLGPLVFRHEPCGEVGEVAGHLHPAVKVRASGRSVRRRCFVSDGKCLVMPALGAFTGGLNVCDEAFLALFGRSWTAYALGADRIYTIEATRCEPDGMRAAGAGWRL